MAELSIASASALTTAAWVARDRTPPSWDQSHYLWDGVQYLHAFQRGGLGGLSHAYFTVERFYGPGYPLLLFPFQLVLGPSPQSSLMANVVLWFALVAAIAGIARRLFGGVAGPLAAAVTATVPLLVYLSHQALVDLAAVTWASLSVLTLIASRHLLRAGPVLLAGAFAGVGLLTKATVLLFLAGPVTVILFRALLRLRQAPRSDRIRAAVAATGSLAVALAVAGPWYLVNWYGTLGYLQSATGGALALGAGPANPFAPAAAAALALSIARATGVALLVGLVAATASLLVRQMRRRESHVHRPWTWALLVAWVAVPIVALAASHNQDPRYAAVSLPALAILFAGLALEIRPPVLRALVPAAVLALGLGALVGSAVSAPPDRSGDAATPVLQQLERMAGGRPLHVLVAQEDSVFNANTLTYLAAVRNDGLTFARPDLTGDPAELDSYDAVVYLPGPELERRDTGLRLYLLNQKAATTVFGDRLFGVFSRARNLVTLPSVSVWVLER